MNTSITSTSINNGELINSPYIQILEKLDEIDKRLKEQDMEISYLSNINTLWVNKLSHMYGILETIKTKLQ